MSSSRYPQKELIRKSLRHKNVCTKNKKERSKWMAAERNKGRKKGTIDKRRRKRKEGINGLNSQS